MQRARESRALGEAYETAHAIGHASREVQRDWPIYLLAPVVVPVLGVVLVVGVLVEAGLEAIKERKRR